MEVVIRPVAHVAYESVKTDAISCTYDMDGFTLMNEVLKAYRLDREHFRKCASMHESRKFRVISHGDKKPFVITTTKTERWDSEPSATEQILNTADAERCESLCMTHFAYILSAFPADAFMQCLRQIEQAVQMTQLKRVVLDVDERYADVANDVYRQVKLKIAEDDHRRVHGNRGADKYHLILGLGSSAQRLVLRYKSKEKNTGFSGNLIIAAKDANATCLDGLDFDREEIQTLVDGAARVLLVVCAGGRDGADMAKFAVQHAFTKKIPVDSILSKPFEWEGSRKRRTALSLLEDLRATGADVIVVESASLETDDLGWEEQFMQLDAAMVKEVDQWSLGRA